MIIIIIIIDQVKDVRVPENLQRAMAAEAEAARNARAKVIRIKMMMMMTTKMMSTSVERGRLLKDAQSVFY